MRIANWAIGVALIGSLMASAAWAQSVQAQQTAVQPGLEPGVQQAAYGYAEADDDVPPAPDPVLASPSVGAAGNWSGYGSCGTSGDCGIYGSCGACPTGDCGACMQCCPFEPLRLFGQHPSGIEAGGWVSVGAHGNQHRNSSNGPVFGFNDIADGINLHQLWFYLGKEAKTDGCGWDWGARVDYVYGVDGQDTQAFRGTQWDVDWDYGGGYGAAIPQLYTEIAIDYLTVKAGYFYTLIGYEVVQAPQNFFYSHSYTQYYIEPFTHTGAVATYDGFEDFTFYAGWTAGWDTCFEKVGDSNMFLGGITYSPSDDLSVTYMSSIGNLDSITYGTGKVYMHSIVMDLQLTDRLEWVIQSDLHHRDGQQNNVAAGGVNQYMFYKVNECWSIGGRFEWLYDRNGAFVNPGLASGSYYNLTGGINWKPHTNLTIRPEIRYDWFSGTYFPGGLPFDDATTDEQLSFGVDLIMLY